MTTRRIYIPRSGFPRDTRPRFAAQPSRKRGAPNSKTPPGPARLTTSGISLDRAGAAMV